MATPTLRKLTGTQKAAVLLMSVDKAQATKVLRTMRESEVAEIAAEIARLQTVPGEQVESVLTEFREMAAAQVNIATGGLDYARQVLEDSLGSAKANEIMELLSATIIDAPFEFLRNADPRQVLSFISEEHPQTIALVLVHM